VQNADSVTGSFKQQGEPNDSTSSWGGHSRLWNWKLVFTQNFLLYYINRVITSWTFMTSCFKHTLTIQFSCFAL